MLPLLAIAQMGLGMAQAKIASDKLKDLTSHAAPEFTEEAATMEARHRAERNSMYGFSPQEKAAWNQNQGMLGNKRYRMATSMAGGSLAGAIGAGVNYGSYAAANDFAMKDAAVQRQNINYADSFTKNLQSIQDRNTQNKYTYRMNAERALGEAIKAGTNNMGSGLAKAENGGGSGGMGGLDSMTQGIGGMGKMNNGLSSTSYNLQRGYSSPWQGYGMGSPTQRSENFVDQGQNFGNF